MAQTFEIEPIRKVGANGTLDAIGLEWTEQSSWRYSNRPMMIVMGLPLAAFVLFCGVLVLFWSGNPLVLLLGGLFLFWTIRYMIGPLPKRAVIFKRDGTVLVPHGTPEGKKWRSMKARQPDIVSFEIGPARSGMQQDWTSSVQFVTKTGRTATVSCLLHREEAREVVVGLNMALAEMRKSVGTDTAHTAQPARKAQAAQRRAVVE